MDMKNQQSTTNLGTNFLVYLAKEASRDRIESLVFLAGSSVNEDVNLSHLHMSEVMKTFFPDMLCMTGSEFAGLAKSHIYKLGGNGPTLCFFVRKMGVLYL
ncbi:hypothetical protein BDZ94DRAFT_1306581 [Collybia nuda]|uniref:Uncharacterized protein n=1 Tax=Collybia nuda TaxID=64659 RepID=A0A9P5YA73_9AGAR|nr:hypothetical protein BDZ94DRAFT_1306581 [Collybia nuda]